MTEFALFQRVRIISASTELFYTPVGWSPTSHPGCGHVLLGWFRPRGPAHQSGCSSLIIAIVHMFFMANMELLVLMMMAVICSFLAHFVHWQNWVCAVMYCLPFFGVYYCIVRCLFSMDSHPDQMLCPNFLHVFVLASICCCLVVMINELRSTRTLFFSPRHNEAVMMKVSFIWWVWVTETEQ